MNVSLNTVITAFGRDGVEDLLINATKLMNRTLRLHPTGKPPPELRQSTEVLAQTGSE